MKKSKIIVPALAVLTLSTAAAVTGTVAWFTANRLATVENAAITAYNPENGLQVTLSDAKGAQIGTAVGSGDTAANISHKELRDASVDFSTVASPKVWGSVLADDGQTVTGYRDVSAAALAGTKAGTHDTNKDYFWCSIYTATFRLVSGASSESYTLKYDNTKLAANAHDLAIAPALRIAIVAGGNVQVIAPFSAAATSSYVKGASDASGSYDVLNSDQTGNFVMGTLTGTGTIIATVYTWFEGTDAACDEDNVDTSKAAEVSLGFTISQ